MWLTVYSPQSNLPFTSAPWLRVIVPPKAGSNSVLSHVALDARRMEWQARVGMPRGKKDRMRGFFKDSQ